MDRVKHHLERIVRVRPCRAQLGKPQDGLQGVAELMADAGDEVAVAAVRADCGRFLLGRQVCGVFHGDQQAQALALVGQPAHLGDFHGAHAVVRLVQLHLVADARAKDVVVCIESLCRRRRHELVSAQAQHMFALQAHELLPGLVHGQEAAIQVGRTEGQWNGFQHQVGERQLVLQLLP